MTFEDIEATVGDFVAAAVRAERAGFDGVELHGAHGYLLGQFLDTSRNHRPDAYGGSLDNRFRIVREVMEGIRAATGDEFQLGLRLSRRASGYRCRTAVSTRAWPSKRVCWTTSNCPCGMCSCDPAVAARACSSSTSWTCLAAMLRLELRAKCCPRRIPSGVWTRVRTSSRSAEERLCTTISPREPWPTSRSRRARCPVPVDVLRQERVGPAFVDYLLETFPDVVEAESQYVN